MRCASCGAENPDGAKFCIECAAPFPRRCARCGAENLPRAKFCAECATPLTGRPEGEQANGGNGETEKPPTSSDARLSTLDSRRDAGERRGPHQVAEQHGQLPPLR